MLHIIDVKTRKSQKIEMEMDGVFSAAWSPKGNEIAFVGHVGSSSDIYIYDVNKRTTRKITDDIFTDSYPSWNPLGTQMGWDSLWSVAVMRSICMVLTFTV